MRKRELFHYPVTVPIRTLVVAYNRKQNQLKPKLKEGSY